MKPLASPASVTTTERFIPSEYHPFLNRAGVDEARLLPVLETAPEHPVSPEQQEALKRFAEGLMRGEWEGYSVNQSPLEEVVRIPDGARSYGAVPEYFTMGEGASHAGELGLQGLNAEQIRLALTDVFKLRHDFNLRNQNTFDSQDELDKAFDKTLDTATKASKKWCDEIIQNALLEGTEPEIPEGVGFHTDPKVVLDKFEKLMAYRHFYRDVKRAISTDGEIENKEVKLLILAMHAGRITELLAKDMYAPIDTIAQQTMLHSESPEHQEIAELLAEAAPVVASVYSDYKETGRHHSMEDFFRRLDYVRDGVAESSDGSLSPIAPQVEHLLNAHKARELHPQLPNEVIEKLRTVEWDASKVVALNEAVLRRLGILSGHKATYEEIKKRAGFAPDGEYQVVSETGKSSLRVDTVKRVIFVGEDLKRGLIDVYPAGVLPGTGHEVLHALQGKVDNEVSQTLPLAAIKGRRYLTVREGGGIAVEQAMQEKYFGQERRANPHYLRALETKLAGGSRVAVARSFFDSLKAGTDLASMNEEARRTKVKSMAKTAVDRSERLYRQGGFNSQPLNYIEQELISSQLAYLSPSDRNKMLLRLSSFNVGDVATLHSYGLYPQETAYDNIDVAEVVMQVFIEEFADEALQTT